jgi:hypothetical protein
MTNLGGFNEELQDCLLVFVSITIFSLTGGLSFAGPGEC